MRETEFFAAALPVWPYRHHETMNLGVGFCAPLAIPAGDNASTILRIAAADTYRVFVNGDFAAYGPARAPHGYLRVDEWDISRHLVTGVNHLAIEVVAHRVNSYGVINQPGLLQVEVVRGTHVLAQTAPAGRTSAFTAWILKDRVRRVQRYSHQRPFTEVYRLDPGSYAWRVGKDPAAPLPLDMAAARMLLPRRMPYPEFPLYTASATSHGTIAPLACPPPSYSGRFVADVGIGTMGFTDAEVEDKPSRQWQDCEWRPAGTAVPADGRLAAGQYRDYDLGTNRSGFVQIELVCQEPARLLVGWDEILVDGGLDIFRANWINLAAWNLQPGCYALETFEPYTLRHLRLALLEGAVKIERVGLRGYEGPAPRPVQPAEPALAAVVRAATATFQQNTADIWSDCPSRERAGWLADSFFTARAAKALGVPIDSETAFLENFLLAPDYLYGLPAGMIPKLYPGDNDNATFIPQWTLWLVLQLADYQKRGGEAWLIEAFRPKIRGLLDWFAGYRNPEGLLEKLPGWNFVEWSKANQLVHDVNFPTNWLYAAALRCAARLYGETAWSREADAISHTATRLGRRERFFADRAMRRDNRLETTDDYTEVCQYSAFYFNAVSPATEPTLWRTLVEAFGPLGSSGFAEVTPANLMFGWCMRFDLLARYGERERLLAEIRACYEPMADRTGTLWEHVVHHGHALKGSCCHAYGSFVLEHLAASNNLCNRADGK